MSSFKNSDGLQIAFKLIKAIQDNKKYLSDIDGAIGDGDHGINMNKGFTMFEDRLKGKDCTWGEALSMLGDVLFNEIGGSMGPIYGLFFAEMGESLEGKEDVDAQAFNDMLKSGLGALQEIVTAQEGDKTLMDVLIPAQRAFEQAMQNGETFTVALIKMKEAAEKGKDATKDMIARLGRASRLGERSKGVIDAGAASCDIILSTMADGMILLLAE